MRAASHSTEDIGAGVDGARFIVCRLAGQEYAIPAESVREVVRFVAVTPLPESPPWVLGVIDVRGHVVPVVDGRRRLGLPEREDWLNAAIVLLAHDGEVGLVVDEAVDMVTIAAEALEPAGGTAGVFAVGRVGDRLLLIIEPSAAMVAGAGIL